MKKPLTLIIALLLATTAALHASQDASAAQPAPAAVDLDLQGFVDGRLKGEERRVVVPPGRYSVTPENGVHLRLKDLSDVELIADGVEIVWPGAFRDGFAFWNPERKEHGMLVTATPVNAPMGGLAYAHTADLKNWKMGEPFPASGRFAGYECPNLMGAGFDTGLDAGQWLRTNPDVPASTARFPSGCRVWKSSELSVTTFCTFPREFSPPHPAGSLDFRVTRCPTGSSNDDQGMATTTRSQSRYDHRLRDLVRTTRDITCALQHGVPRSTARGWLTGSAAPVVTVDVLNRDTLQLQQEILRLRTRIQKLIALLRVLLVVLRISKFSLDRTRLPDGCLKRSLLRVIDRSRAALPLRAVLRVIRLSPARYHHWNRIQQCPLDDRPSCPRRSPQQLTPTEVQVIRDLATSPDYRHVPTGTLAILAQRLGKVFASASTWYRQIRAHHWRRPRQRIHPAPPQIGIRASRPNQIWHIDTTLLRLLDGSRAYLHAVIDNFSRRILAWKLTSTFAPAATVEILLAAAKGLEHGTPTLLTDGGPENVNAAVDELIHSGLLQRVLARTEITYSNSLIESWWRVLKHQWLYLNTLDTVSAVEKLVRFYVQEHNTRLPHSAFHGQTPDEMYFQTGDHIPQQLETARQAARPARAAANRKRDCGTCELLVPSRN